MITETIQTLINDYIEIAGLLKEHYKDFPPEVQVQVIRSFTDAAIIARRRSSTNDKQEANASVRGWCLSPEFGKEFIARNKDRLAEALFEDATDE